jgi:hypothetical protein
MSKQMLQLTVSLCLALTLSCTHIARVTGLQTQDLPKVSAVRGKIGLVHLPDAFTRKDFDRRFPGEVKIITSLEYDLRESAGPAHELILAMKDYLDENLKPAMSDNFFAVSLDGNFITRTASAAEWQRAHALTSINEDHSVFDSPIKWADKNGSVSYNGKRYAMQDGCAASETRFFLSPGRKWLVVMSDDSKPANRPGIPGFSGGGRTDGRMYIDIYDTKSGEKIMSARAGHAGCPACNFSESLWVGDSYFIVTIDPPGEDRGSVGEDFFLALMPQ